MRARGLLIALVVTVLLGAAPQDRIYQSLLDGNWSLAAKLLDEYLQRAPHDHVMLYNAACVWTQLGDPDRAATYLRRSVDSGNRDLAKILADPDLEPLRSHPTYKSVVARLSRQRAVRRGDPLEHWKAVHGTDYYRYSRDEVRRIGYATALDATSQQEVERMIERETDHLRATLFSGPLPEDWLLVAVPTPSDAAGLFADEHTGGMYEHDKRRLMARDTGASLRHELVHAWHYQHMEALRQKHPLWVQEGLAALYETYVLADDGAITFVPNERHNVVVGLARAGKLTHWDVLFALSAPEFMEDATRLYPQVRSIFEFIADRGLLVKWYEALRATIDKDPTGGAAFSACFGDPLPLIERDWRRWMMGRPPVDLDVRAGDASLGIETRPNASNDGVLITRVLPGSAAAKGDLKAGDVIVAVDGRPTRTLTELAAVIAAKSVGERVTVRARRARDYFMVVVALRPMDALGG